MSRSFIAALTSLSVDMRRLSCALVACFKAAVMVSRMESGGTLFREEAPKIIERVRSGKGICEVNLLFSQENNFVLWIDPGRRRDIRVRRPSKQGSWGRSP